MTEDPHFRCFAVEPGYHQFPARCARFRGHIGDHESTFWRSSGYEPVRWPVDDSFTSEE